MCDPERTCNDDEEMGRFWASLTRGYCLGTPLTRILESMESTLEEGPMLHAARELALRVAEGTSLAEAMAAQPSVFSRAHVALVEGGSRLGILDRVLPLILEATWRCPACASLRVQRNL